MPDVSGYAYDAFISYSRQHDRVLGPVLHADLQRFAKPWYKARALRIFLDAADLSVGGGIRPSIREALGSSQFFILLASADAAKSTWVNREVRWWLDHHRSPERLLVVATGRGLAWDEEARDWVADAPVPRALRGAFSQEPIWVDLSDIPLDDGRPVIPADKVGTLVAAIRRVDKDKLVGEHLRQHRRAMRLAKGAITALTTLTALAVAASLIAIGQRNTAITQSRNAQSEQLAAEATNLSATNVPLAMLLSVAAYERAPTADARTALTQAAKQPLDLLLTTGTSAVTAIAYSRDGKDLATGDADGRIVLWNIATRQHASITIGNSGNSPITALAFSPDQSTFYAGNDAGAFAEWDTQTGKSQTSSGTNPIQCLTFSPNGKFLAAGFADGNTLLSNVATGQGVNLSEGYQGTKTGNNYSITTFAQPVNLRHSALAADQAAAEFCMAVSWGFPGWFLVAGGAVAHLMGAGWARAG